MGANATLIVVSNFNYTNRVVMFTFCSLVCDTARLFSHLLVLALKVTVGKLFYFVVYVHIGSKLNFKWQQRICILNKYVLFILVAMVIFRS